MRRITGRHDDGYERNEHYVYLGGIIRFFGDVPDVQIVDKYGSWYHVTSSRESDSTCD